MTRDQRSELLQSLALRGFGIRIAVVLARDVEGEGPGRLEPSVRTLLAQYVEQIAEETAERVVSHVPNLWLTAEDHAHGPFVPVAQQLDVDPLARGRGVKIRQEGVDRVQRGAVQLEKDVAAMQLAS